MTLLMTGIQMDIVPESPRYETSDLKGGEV
jgi:hypothetical protein